MQCRLLLRSSLIQLENRLCKVGVFQVADLRLQLHLKRMTEVDRVRDLILCGPVERKLIIQVLANFRELVVGGLYSRAVVGFECRA